MDNNYDEYVREEIEITVMDIIMKNIKKLAGRVGTVFECAVRKEHCRRSLEGKTKQNKER
jgi:hypothetical protein